MFTNILKEVKNAPTSEDAKEKEPENDLFNYLLSLSGKKTPKLLNNTGVSKWVLQNIFQISQIY